MQVDTLAASIDVPTSRKVFIVTPFDRRSCGEWSNVAGSGGACRGASTALFPLQSLKKDNSGLANWLLFDCHERSDKSGAFAGS